MEFSKARILAAIATLATLSTLVPVILINTETPRPGTRGGVAPSITDLVTYVHLTERVNVYVYDVPELDFSPVVRCYQEQHGVSPWQHEREESAQNTGEIWLHQALLAHPWRVLDPDKADIFYIPLYAVTSQVLDWGDQNDPPVGTRVKRRCEGYTHSERMDTAVDFLATRSPHFVRFGGADHAFVCAWWGCPLALGPTHRMILRRVIVGVTDKDFSKYTGWGCGKQRQITVPYTASSFLTTTEAVGGRSTEERDIPMFFVGSARGRAQRENLARYIMDLRVDHNRFFGSCRKSVLHDLSNDSVILITDNHHEWSMNASTNAEHMTRSMFCFCPPGDTETSRRFFDSLAAGCIPVVTEDGTKAFPFPELDYSQFAVVVDNTAFDQTWKVIALARFLTSRSADEIAHLRRGARLGMRNMVYGVTDGPELSDMQPFHGTTANFLRAARVMSGLDRDSPANVWECWVPGLDPHLALRTSADIPPRPILSRYWLYETETIVDEANSLLFCAPPNTGSLQVRMLAKRMQGIGHWDTSNSWALLFDSDMSGLPLLDQSDVALMNRIFRDNGSGWVKIGFVRDPVTRLLSAYLDLVRSLIWNQLQGRQHVRSRAAYEEAKHPLTEQEKLWVTEGWAARYWRRTWYEDGAGDEIKIPTFAEVLKALHVDVREAPPAFRPMASLCGANFSPFDAIIPFESLKSTATEVFKSLPGDIWQDYGASGWGPHGKDAFMQFDYGGAVIRSIENVDPGSVGETLDGLGIPSRTSDLFEGSCRWTEFYTDVEMLETVATLYELDFSLYGWYNIDGWKEEFKRCQRSRW